MISLGTYDLHTLQIYFNASLEIQEELIRAGFNVPFQTPVPIIYSDKRGRGTVKKAYILDPQRYGKTPAQLGWKQTGNTFYIPGEISKVEIFLETKNEKHLLHFKILSNSTNAYHLEKASSRQVNPNKWNNWAMLYLDIDDLIHLVNKILDALGWKSFQCNQFYEIFRETVPNPGGLEVTFYTAVKPESYNFCLGCFNFVEDYLNNEAKSSLKPFKPEKLNLCLTTIPEVYLKVGIAKIAGIDPQFMIKLFTIKKAKRIVIKGIAGDVEGKPRGRLTYCDHEISNNQLTINVITFLSVVCCFFDAFKIPHKLPLECKGCYKLRAKLPGWF